MPLLLSLCSGVWEPQLLKPKSLRACALQREATTMGSPSTTTREELPSAPAATEEKTVLQRGSAQPGANTTFRTRKTNAHPLPIPFVTTIIYKEELTVCRTKLTKIILGKKKKRQYWVVSCARTLFPPIHQHHEKNLLGVQA